MTDFLPPELLTLTSQDGFLIRAAHFPGLKYTSQPVVVPCILIAPATGVQASFYYTFASYLSSQGAAVVVLDYRYLGKSFPKGVDVNDREECLEALRGAKDTLVDREWQWDFNAALKWCIGRYKERGVVVIGHSAGGHLLSTSPPALWMQVDRALHIGVLCPWFDYTSDPVQSREGKKYLFEETDRLGYFPSRAANLGNDLPAGVGKQWFGWMEFPTYQAHFHQEELNHFTVPCLSLAFSDDLFGQGNATMTDATLSTYPISPSTRLWLDPAKMGWQAAGHINVFHKYHAEDLGREDRGVWGVLGEWVLYGRAREDGGERRDFNGGVEKGLDMLRRRGESRL